MSLDTIREFLGWCTVVNFGLMVFSMITVFSFRSWASKFHSALFGVDAAAVRLVYVQYFAAFKIVVIVFNMVPYIALRIMS